MENNASEIFNLGKCQTSNGNIEDVPFYIIPNDMKIEKLDDLADKFRKKPVRIHEITTVYSEQSFCEYFNRYQNEHSTVIIDFNQSRVVGFIDYHESTEEPRYKNHCVIYSFPKTPEFSAWFNNDNSKLSQEEFAYFIEERFGEIVEPNAAAMLQVAQNLKATKEVNFKQSKRLDNGQNQFIYEETINGTCSSGDIEVPELFKIQLQIFKFGAAYKLSARLRYRISPNGLSFWYTLINPQRSLDDAIADVEAYLTENCITEHIYMGDSSI
jgi:uncharacterized protein YfdQ (DUF2303 family)